MPVPRFFFFSFSFFFFLITSANEIQCLSLAKDSSPGRVIVAKVAACLFPDFLSSIFVPAASWIKEFHCTTLVRFVIYLGSPKWPVSVFFSQQPTKGSSRISNRLVPPLILSSRLLSRLAERNDTNFYLNLMFLIATNEQSTLAMEREKSERDVFSI